MKHHPEQLDDEIYMWNTTLERFHELSWKTKRLGSNALNIHNQPFPTELRPWFIKRKEVEEAIKAELANGDKLDRVDVYRGMLGR